MGAPLGSVTIVGGGTAGWLTAAMLHTALGQTRDRKGIDITLIESPNVPTVGVGEATVPGMPRTLQACGISEREFFKTCNASFKLGVLFGNWNVDRDGKFVDYINPFARPNAPKGVELAVHYLAHGAGGRDFMDTFSPINQLAAECRGPKKLGGADYKIEAGYAYHLDAGRFAGMLRDAFIERGVHHILDDVVDVEQDERGYISALEARRAGATTPSSW